MQEFYTKINALAAILYHFFADRASICWFRAYFSTPSTLLHLLTRRGVNLLSAEDEELIIFDNLIGHW